MRPTRVFHLTAAGWRTNPTNRADMKSMSDHPTAVGDPLGPERSFSIQTEPQFAGSKPTVLFEGSYDPGVIGFRNYDVSVDGQRFVMIQKEDEPAPTEIIVVLNWFEELKRLLPVNGFAR